jgi:ParB/RepB/Spo0J family partition protein
MTDKTKQIDVALAAASTKAEGKAVSSNPAGITKRTNAYFADPKTITRRAGWNPRFEFGEIDELAKSIKVNGILNPLRIKRLATPVDGKIFELIDGDRRLTAVEFLMKAGTPIPALLDGVPVIIVDKAQDDLTSLIQMFEANSGKVFLPLEEAAAYQRMRDAGMTIKQICASVGRKQVHVVEILALMEAGDDLKEATKSGEVGKTLAKKIAVVAKGDKAKQKELVEQAKAAGTDTNKRRALKQAVESTRQAKAKKQGRVLKIRALDDVALSGIGTKMAAQLAEMLKDLKLPVNYDFRAWISEDADLKMAYAFGALEALKVAAGQPDNLVL